MTRQYLEIGYDRFLPIPTHLFYSKVHPGRFIQHCQNTRTDEDTGRYPDAYYNVGDEIQ
jgi:hypothetical protein